jgi:hypothetical protein
MSGTVTSYTAATQVLVCSMTTTSGSGTFTSWRIGYRGPRFDHDSAGVCRGLLIEESRTNSFQRSDDFGNAYWTKLRSTITSDTTTSPSGATDADKLVEDTSSNTHIVFRLVGLGVTTPVSFSVFAKASERSWIQLECGDNFPAGATAYFNLSNGTIGTVGAGATASIQSMGNGWYRCVVVATPTATTGNGFYIYTATANGTRSYTGNGTSGVFLWGAQVEAGSFAASYIPTVASSVVRSADVCSITGGNFTSFYNQSEGTFFADVFGLMSDLLGGNRGFAVITDGTYNNTIGIFKSASAALIRAEGTTGNVAQFSLSNVYAPFTQYKVALGVRTNDTNAAFNGSLKTTDTSVTLPSTMNRLEFRDPTGASGGQPSCHLAAIRYYRKRLSNAKLQALTV